MIQQTPAALHLRRPGIGTGRGIFGVIIAGLVAVFAVPAIAIVFILIGFAAQVVAEQFTPDGIFGAANSGPVKDAVIMVVFTSALSFFGVYIFLPVAWIALGLAVLVMNWRRWIRVQTYMAVAAGVGALVLVVTYSGLFSGFGGSFVSIICAMLAGGFIGALAGAVTGLIMHLAIRPGRFPQPA